MYADPRICFVAIPDTNDERHWRDDRGGVAGFPDAFPVSAARPNAGIPAELFQRRRARGLFQHCPVGRFRIDGHGCWVHAPGSSRTRKGRPILCGHGRGRCVGIWAEPGDVVVSNLRLWLLRLLSNESAFLFCPVWADSTVVFRRLLLVPPLCGGSLEPA